MHYKFTVTPTSLSQMKLSLMANGEYLAALLAVSLRGWALSFRFSIRDFWVGVRLTRFLPNLGWAFSLQTIPCIALQLTRIPLDPKEPARPLTDY